MALMKKILKTLAFALGGIAAAGLLAFAVALWLGERKLERVVDVRVVPVAFAKDPAAATLGKYLYESRGCAECHGADGRGVVFVDAPNGMRLKSPNITRGPGGVVATYSEGDWVRAIRHGVNPRGHALMVMPSEDFARMNDDDFAALVAYVRSLPNVAGSGADLRIPAIVKALYGVGAIQDAAEKIDHKAPPPAPVAVAVNARHGGYVANMCMGCHGQLLAGGRVPGGPPEWPPAANLTPGQGSVMPRYDSAEKFISMMRTGKRPDGTEVDKAMPFMTLRSMNDTDLNAVYAYLRSLAPHAAGER
jgi:mono/diheme cytochrome c family protein